MPLPYIAAGLAGAGLLSKLFGKSEEEQRQERIALLRKKISEAKSKALTEGQRAITEQTAGQVAGARQSGAARAIAMGRGNQVDDFTVPGEQRALTAGSGALRGFTRDTNRDYDQQMLNAEFEFAQRPIAPDVGDYLLEAGDAVGQFAQNQQLIDAYSDNNTSDAEFEDIAPMKPKANWEKYRPVSQQPRLSASSLRYRGRV